MTADHAQLILLDDLPDDTELPETTVPVVMYGHKANIDNGHLLIASTEGDWLFLWRGGGVIECCLPGWSTGVNLTPPDLRVLGEYCLRMADRIERAT